MERHLRRRFRIDGQRRQLQLSVNYQSTDSSSAVVDANGGHVEADGGSFSYTIDANGVVHYKMVESDGKVTEWTADGSITQ